MSRRKHGGAPASGRVSRGVELKSRDGKQHSGAQAVLAIG